MVTSRLQTPITSETVRRLRVNDVVYLTGTVVTARDQAHRRALALLKEKKPLPVDLEGLAVYHCGPVIRKLGSNWKVFAAGPTTSTRLETCEAEFLEVFKPRIIIGKGGMGNRTNQAMAQVGAVYCAFTGGAAVLAAQMVNSVREVHWLDLGMPEALWILEVQNFGPLFVAIDAHGGNLYADVAANVEKNKQKIYRKLGL